MPQYLKIKRCDAYKLQEHSCCLTCAHSNNSILFLFVNLRAHVTAIQGFLFLFYLVS